MGQLTARLLDRLRAWDMPSRIALMLALVLLVATLLIAALGPAEFRQYALVASVGLIIVTQVIILWANRGMVTPYTSAQRAYMVGDFDLARQILETSRAAGKADVRELTLLGNIYRQLGQLEKSEEILTGALSLRPDHYFPLYGFGRTLLVQGRYAEAAQVLARALALGAPPVARFDLGDACFRQGLWDDARAALNEARPLIDEPHRALMADYLLCRLESGDKPSPELIQTGLPYWRAEAERFRQTPYGQALAVDVLHLQTLGGGQTDV